MTHSARFALLALLVCASGWAGPVTQVTQLAQATQSTAPTISVTSAAGVTPLIELYTSEGCSSCPPADKFLVQLGDTLDEDFHALPLAFHVDYWNWLGWTDPYSSAQFTERQRFLAHINGQRSMYTPEFLVSGREARGGTDIVRRIGHANRQPPRVDIGLGLDAAGADRINAAIHIDNRAAGAHAELHVAIYENDIVRDILRGENAGRTLTYSYVVRHWSDPVRVRDGESRVSRGIRMQPDWVTDNLGLAVVVLDALTGETLQSVRTPLHALFPGSLPES